jgi:hypothetical protein
LCSHEFGYAYWSYNYSRYRTLKKWRPAVWAHRYLMTRLSLQVVYLWRHVSSTAPPFILWWSDLDILFGPLHRSSPFIGELRCQAIQMEHGPYIAERTQNAVFIVRCLCMSFKPGFLQEQDFPGSNPITADHLGENRFYAEQ